MMNDAYRGEDADAAEDVASGEPMDSFASQGPLDQGPLDPQDPSVFASYDSALSDDFFSDSSFDLKDSDLENPNGSDFKDPEDSKDLKDPEDSKDLRDPENSQNPNREDGSSRRTVSLIALVCGALVVALVIMGIFAWRDLQAFRTSFGVVTESISQAKTSLFEGNSTSAERALARLVSEVDAMDKRISSPLWDALNFVPGLGGDVHEAQELISAVNRFSNEGIVPIEDAVGTFNVKDLVHEGGVISIDGVRTLVSILDTVAEPAQQLKGTLDSLKGFSIPPLQERFSTLKSQVSDLTTVLSAVAPLAPHLPQLLGADGQTQNYLILALNPAEQRPSGGLLGAWGLLSFTDGVATLGDFGVANGTPIPDETITVEEANVLEGGGFALSPDFPRAAQIAAASWEYVHGTPVNCVVAVDPIFLQGLLSLVGPVSTSSGITLDGSNAAQILMHDAYVNLPWEQTDAFFAEVAKIAFSNFFARGGDIDFSRLFELIDGAIEGRHLQIWMVDGDREEAIRAFGAAGELERNPQMPELGVYLIDLTYSKIDWYLQIENQIGEGIKNEDGSTTYPVVTTLTNTMTQEEATTLPEYVTGYNYERKRSVGDIVTELYFVAPAGGRVADLSWEGAVSDPLEQTLYGFGVERTIVNVAPGESATFTYHVTTSPEAVEPLVVRMAAQPHDVIDLSTEDDSQ